MKTINYFNYNNNKGLYNEVEGTYNSKDNTIKVYDRKVIEFDYKLDNGSKVHLKFFNKNLESDNTRFGYYYKKTAGKFDYSDCFFSVAKHDTYLVELLEFYRDNKDVLDKLVTEKIGYEPDDVTTRQKNKCLDVIEEVFKDLLYNKFYLLDYNSYLDIFKQLEGNEIFNVKVYDPDADGLN